MRILFFSCFGLLLFNACGGDSLSVQSESGGTSSSENEGASISISANSADGGASTSIGGGGGVNISSSRYKLGRDSSEVTSYCFSSSSSSTRIRIFNRELASSQHSKAPESEAIELEAGECASIIPNPDTYFELFPPLGSHKTVSLISTSNQTETIIQLD